MTTQADLKRVENPNSRIVRIEQIQGKTNEVLMIGESVGRTEVTFIDQTGRVEVCAVLVQDLPKPRRAHHAGKRRDH